MSVKMICSPISLLSVLLALLFCGCGKPVFTKFLVQYKSPELIRFFEANARTAVMPVLTKEYTTLNFNVSAKEAEDFIRAGQGQIPLLPFNTLAKAVNDSNALGVLVNLLNQYYKKGEINPEGVTRITGMLREDAPKFILFLKLEQADLYRDTKKDYKIQLTISGKLYYVKSRSVVLSFVCTSFSRNADKSELPGLDEIVRTTLKEMAGSLPYDPDKAVLREKSRDW